MTRVRGRSGPAGRTWQSILLMASVIATLYTAGWLWQDMKHQKRLASSEGPAPKTQDGKKSKAISLEDSIFKAECNELRKREALLQEQLAEARSAGYLSDTDASQPLLAHLSAADVAALGGKRTQEQQGLGWRQGVSQGIRGGSSAGSGSGRGNTTGVGQGAGGGVGQRRLLAVVMVNTGFEDRLTRDAVRSTWMPTGAALQKLEEDMGVVLRFAIGRSPNRGDSLDQAVAQENEAHHDIIIMVKSMMAAAVRHWPNADFYFKVNDDVYLSVVQLVDFLRKLRSRTRLYLGCFKSGVVVTQEGGQWYEPNWPKFGDGKQYPNHAAAPVYGFTREIARYIAFNREMLHEYANEDTSVGAWLLGLSASYEDERRLCCASPPGADDCTEQRSEGHPCVAVFDWRCNGLCEAATRMGEVHQKCA